MCKSGSRPIFFWSWNRFVRVCVCVCVHACASVCARVCIREGKEEFDGKEGGRKEFDSRMEGGKKAL
jgi:hypothetical protein